MSVLCNKLRYHVCSTAVLSYNGSTYDINLVKNELFTQLGLTKSSNKSFVIKQNSKYTVLSTECFRFMLKIMLGELSCGHIPYYASVAM